MTQPELLTSPQVAVLLGRSPRTVHRLVQDGKLIPAMQLGGPNGAFLFERASVMALIQSLVPERRAAA